MKYRDFYIDALLARAYKRKAWVISAFSVVRGVETLAAEDDPETQAAPYAVRYKPDATEVFVNKGDDWGWEVIEDAAPMQPLLYPCDPLTIQPGNIPNCNEVTETTYGDLLFNWIVLVEPFNDIIPYQVGPVSISAVERLVAAKLVSDEDSSGIPPKEGDITVQMYMRFGRCIGALAGFAQVFVPTMTPKALTTDPGVRAKRAELLEKHKDRLFDPVVQAEIQNELIAMDKAWVKDDPSEGFLLSNKTFGTARKRMFLIHGPEAGFDEGGNAELVVNSLNEGWDTDHLVAMFNSTRAGSFYRGAQTALGGEAVKFFMRMFQNATVSEEDCGTKLGMYRRIAKGTGNKYIGLYEIVGNSIRRIDETRAKEIEGTTILTRSPSFCKTDGTDFCARCVGDALASIPFALAQEATAIASKFMDVMMASAHAKELKTAKLDFEASFT